MQTIVQNLSQTTSTSPTDSVVNSCLAANASRQSSSSPMSGPPRTALVRASSAAASPARGQVFSQSCAAVLGHPGGRAAIGLRDDKCRLASLLCSSVSQTALCIPVSQSSVFMCSMRSSVSQTAFCTPVSHSLLCSSVSQTAFVRKRASHHD